MSRRTPHSAARTGHSRGRRGRAPRPARPQVVRVVVATWRRPPRVRIPGVTISPFIHSSLPVYTSSHYAVGGRCWHNVGLETRQGWDHTHPYIVLWLRLCRYLLAPAWAGSRALSASDVARSGITAIYLWIATLNDRYETCGFSSRTGICSFSERVSKSGNRSPRPSGWTCQPRRRLS